MRKVVLTMNEENKYKIIKNLVDHNGNKQRAAVKLNCTKRTIDRLIKKYKEEGKEGFMHKNRGNNPHNKIDNFERYRIYLLYKSKYYGANIRHFTELLEREENTKISETTVRTIFKEMGDISPKAHRKTKREFNKKLKDQLKSEKSVKKQNLIKEKIIEVSNPHPRREKSQYFGEMVQIDGSVHFWFSEKIEMHLHAAIDDATGKILGAYFDVQETLNGYYHMLQQILLDYGAPVLLYGDKRTVFEYKRSGMKDISKDTYTQFGYACKQLGIKIKTTSVSQAKGKVERLFGTLQSRLPIEMRIAGVKTIKDANEFLKTYIKEFNNMFALNDDCINSVFEKVDKNKINYTLAVLEGRKIDNGHCVRYHNKYYRIIDKNNHQKYFKPGTSLIVAKTLDNSLYANIEGTVFVIEEISKPKNKKDINNTKENKKPRKKYIPPMDHP